MAIKISGTTVIDDSRALINLGSAIAANIGGTGRTTLTANSVLLGNGTSALQSVSPGNSGNVLISTGSNWISSTAPAGGLTYIYANSSVTLADKQGVLTDTSAGTFTVTLPATPAIGAQVVVADAAGSWGNNNLTIARNGETISNVAEDLLCDIVGVSLQLVYDGTTWEPYAQAGVTGADTRGLTYIFVTTTTSVLDRQALLTDTSAGSFTVTLPASPALGDHLVVADAGNSWGNNSLTIARNGSTIGGLAENLTCNITGASLDLVYDGTTWEVYAQVGGSGGTAVTLTDAQTLTNKTIAFANNTFVGTLSVSNGGTGANTITGVLKGNGTSSITAATAGTDYVEPTTATNFTAKQTFTGSSSTAGAKIFDIIEGANVSATAANGTINYDVTTQAVLYYTTNASGNFTVNFRGSSGTPLNTLMANNESMTVAFLVTNGATAYYNNLVQVDSSNVTPKYQGGTAYAAGNASSIDAYMYTIIKTANATFTVLTSQTKFA